MVLLMLGFMSSNCKKSATSSATATADNSANSLDWAGVYDGSLPCADCDALQTVVVLQKDKKYSIFKHYQGKGDKVFQEDSTFNWNTAGNTIRLEGVKDAPNQFFVGENTLTQLDTEGKKITGALADKYVLKKVGESIFDTQWKLVELRGKPLPANLTKEPFLMLFTKNARVSANGGCNNMMGNYELGVGNRIRFSKMAATLMACPDMSIEAELGKVFETTDSYSLKDKTLSLNRARMAPLARFERVAP